MPLVLDVVPVILETGTDGKVECECGCGQRVNKCDCVVVPSGVTYQARYNVLLRECSEIAWGERLTRGFRPATDPYIHVPVKSPLNDNQQQGFISPYTRG